MKNKIFYSGINTLGSASEDSDFYLKNALPKNNPLLSVTEYGWEKCLPEKYVGPFVRPYYILHYIDKGEGTLIVNKTKNEITENQLFLIPPDVKTAYYPKKDNPWSYYWVGFDGLEAPRLMELCGFINDDNYTLTLKDTDIIKSLMKNITKNNFEHPGSYCVILGLLYQIVGILISANTNYSQSDEFYIRHATAFINGNFAKGITVQEVSDYLGLERSYFFRIFKKHTKQSPKDYLQNIKLISAYNLLISSDMALGEVAEKSGFNDYSHFTTFFKKKYSVSPSELRKNGPPPRITNRKTFSIPILYPA